MIATTHSSKPERRDDFLTFLLPAVVMLLAGLLWGVVRHNIKGNPDLTEYYRYAGALLHGQNPYFRDGMEYPPLSLAPMTAANLLLSGRSWNIYHYAAVFLAIGCVFIGLIAVVQQRMLRDANAAPQDRRLALAALALQAVVSAPFVGFRFDFFPAFLTMLMFWALLRGRAGTSGVFLGLGIAAKLYPIVLVPAALIYLWRTRGTQATIRFALAAVVSLAVFVVPFLAVAPASFLHSFTYHLNRMLEAETLPAGLLMIAYRLKLVQIEGIVGAGSREIVFAWQGELFRVLTATMAASSLFCAALYYRAVQSSSKRDALSDQECLAAAFTAALLCFMLFGKVLSAQYVIWLWPFAAMLPRAGVILNVVLAVLTSLEMGHFGFNLSQFGTAGIVVLNLRNLTAVALLALCIVWLAQAGRAWAMQGRQAAGVPASS